MEKRFWAIIGVILVIFVGFLWFGNDKKRQPDGAKNTQAVSSHIDGNPDAKVTLLEYGDFQCPVCSAYHPVVKQVIEKYKNDIKFQFRNLPLTQIHQNAFAAARAAEAAEKQGKYWEMFDMLYQNQQSWAQATNTQELFKQYASQLGLNSSNFQKDFASSDVNSAINNDVSEFKKTGRDMATPTFFLNGKALESAQLVDAQKNPSVERFSALIDEALKQ